MAWPVFLLLLHLHLGRAWDCPTGENCTAGDLFIWSPTIQLTFINQNTLQITPIKIIVCIAKLCHSIFQRQFDLFSPCCQLGLSTSPALHCHDHCFKIQIKSFAKLTSYSFIQLSYCRTLHHWRTCGILYTIASIHPTF